MTALRRIYEICDQVLRRGGYLSEGLSSALMEDRTDSGFITAVCYGVFDKLIQLDYMLDKFLERRPKPVVMTLLRMGCYLVKYSDMPSYAAVNEMVKLSQEIGKGEVSGLVNAVLKKIDGYVLDLPVDEHERLSIQYSYPLWMVDKLCLEYGLDAKNIMAFTSNRYEHIRINCSQISVDDFKMLLEDKDIGYTPSRYEDCLYCDYSGLMQHEISTALYTKQNEGSVAIVSLMNIKDGSQILDCCAAPGGKAVLMAQQNPSGTVLACDDHEHRLLLVQAYAKRMGVANVTTKCQDGRVFVHEWKEKFDMVLADVPCTGIGVIYSKPDIKFLRKEEDCCALSQLQKEILFTAAKYVKVGGALVYSTCTLFKEENESQIEEFLNIKSNFVAVKWLKMIPSQSGEGFFAVKLLRKS